MNGSGRTNGWHRPAQPLFWLTLLTLKRYRDLALKTPPAATRMRRADRARQQHLDESRKYADPGSLPSFLTDLERPASPSVVPISATSFGASYIFLWLQA